MLLSEFLEMFKKQPRDIKISFGMEDELDIEFKCMIKAFDPDELVLWFGLPPIYGTCVLEDCSRESVTEMVNFIGADWHDSVEDETSMPSNLSFIDKNDRVQRVFVGDTIIRNETGIFKHS
jgi:hypothetical protein